MSDGSLALIGREFRYSVDRPEVVSLLRRHWDFPEHRAEGASTFAIDIRERSSVPTDVERGRPIRVLLHRGALDVRADRSIWTFGDSRAGVRLTTNERGAAIEFWQKDSSALGNDLASALVVAMNEAIRASGLLPVHGAVVARDDLAIALLGPSGVGKSTSLLRLVNDGYRAIAEDFSWLDVASLRVYGCDRGVRLLSDARVREASALPNDSFRLDVDGKHFVSWDGLGAPLSRQAQLRRMVELTRGGDAPRVPVESSARDAVRAWWEAAGVPLDETVRAHTSRYIASLVDRVWHGRLALGEWPITLDTAPRPDIRS